MKFCYIILLFVSISSYSQSCEELKKINEQLKNENTLLNERVENMIDELYEIIKESDSLRIDFHNAKKEMKTLLIDLESTLKAIAIEKKIDNLSDLCKNYFLNLNISDENFEIIDSTSIFDLKNADSNSEKPEKIEDFDNKSKVFLTSNHPINKVNGKLFLTNSKNKNLILNYKFLLLKEENDTIKDKVTKRTWGSGINLQLELSSKEKNIPISSLLELAKNDKINKRYTISPIGLGEEFAKKKYGTAAFTIDTYSKVLAEMDAIIQNISETTKFDPELIKIKY
jgi:hypothetical protein